MKNLHLFTWLLFCSLNLFSQDYHKVDSMEKSLRSCKDDVVRFDLLFSLGEEYWLNSPDSALLYLRKAKTIDSRWKPSMSTIRLYSDFGSVFGAIGDYDSSFLYLRKAVQMARQLNYETRAAFCYNLIATNFFELGDFDSSMQYSNRCIEIYSKTDEVEHITSAYVTLANAIFRKGNFNAAIDTILSGIRLLESLNLNSKEVKGDAYYEGRFNLSRNLATILAEKGIYNRYFFSHLFSALKMAEKLRRKDDISLVYQLFGACYLDLENYSKAKSSLIKAIDLAEKTKNKYHLAYDYFNIANVYFETDKQDSAAWAIQKCIELATQNQDPIILPCAIANKYNFQMRKGKYPVGTLDTLSSYYQKFKFTGVPLFEFIMNLNMSLAASMVGQHAQARRYWETCYAKALEMQSKRFIRDAWMHATFIYEKARDYVKLSEAYKMHLLYKDSVVQEIKGYMAEEYEVVYEISKKEDRIKLLGLSLEKSELQARNYILYLILATLLALFLILVVVVIRNRNRHLLKSKLSAQKKAYFELINDHTLSNILNKAQSHQILGDSMEASKILSQTARFLRHNLKYRLNESHRLSDEISICENFFQCMTPIYGLDPVWKTDASGIRTDLELPPFIILSCLENSVKHGLIPNRALRLEVSMEIKDHNLIVNVTDNGKGIHEETESGHGLGSSAIGKALAILLEEKGREGNYAVENIVEEAQILGCKQRLVIPV